MARTRLILRIVLVAGLVAMAVHRAGPQERTDLPVYLAASRALLDGDDPFGAMSARGWRFNYPPTLPVLVAPLTALPLRVAAGLWCLVGVLAFGVGVRLCRRALGRTGPPGRGDYVALLLVFAPTASALLRGQVGPLLLGLAAGAIVCLARGRDVAAGMLASLAAAIKLTPGLLLVGMLAAGRWRAFGAGVAGFLLWTVVLPAPFLGVDGALASCGRVARVMVVGTAAAPDRLAMPGGAVAVDAEPNNQSLTAQAVRRLPGPAGRVAPLVLGLALLAIGAALARRGRAPPGFGACAFLFAAPLVVTPIAWHHHHVVLFPALLFLVARGARLPLALFAVASLLHFAVEPARPYGLLGWGTLAVLAALVYNRP